MKPAAKRKLKKKISDLERGLVYNKTLLTNFRRGGVIEGVLQGRIQKLERELNDTKFHLSR